MDEQICYQDDEIELIDILRVIWRWKWFIGVVVVIAVAITAGVIMQRFPLRTGSAAIISLSFPGIEKGQNPDGSAFAADQLIAPIIIHRAVEQIKHLDKNRVMANWRDAVTVSPVVPEGIKEDATFFPDKFKVSVFSKTREGEVVFSDKAQTKALLLRIIDAYKDMFETRYIKTFLVPPKMMIDDISPLGALAVIKQKAERLSTEISGLSSEAAGYKSKTQATSLNDIAQEVEIFNDILLKNAMSRILLDFYDEPFVEAYTALSRKIEKNQAEASAARNMLDRLVHEGNEKQAEGIILDSQALEYYSRMDVRKYLVEKALNAEIETNNLQVELKALQSDSKNGNAEEVPSVIIKLKDRVVGMCETANGIYSEYMHDTLDGTIRQVTDIQLLSNRDINVKLMVVLAMVAAFFVAIFLAFFIEYINNAKNRQINR